MTDCVYFLLYLALGKLSLMLLINYMNNSARMNKSNFTTERKSCSVYT